MLKFRFILLLSVALMSSGYRWRCYAFCDEQTAIQNDYTEQRDDCRGFAQDNIDAEMAKAPNPNSVKARKIKLISLFSDCMAQYGWDVPKVNDKGGKLADSGEVPLYTSTVSKLAASEKNPDAEAPNTPAPVEGEITEQDLSAPRKTPVGNIPKQKEIKQQENLKQENLKQENSKNTNNTNNVVQKSAKSKTQSGKSQSATQTDNIQKQPATTKSKNSVKTSKEQNDQKPAGDQIKSSSQKTTSTTSSTTSKIVENPAGEQQSAQPIPPPPPENSTSYRKVINNNNSSSQTTDNKADNNSKMPIQELSPEAGRYEPPATTSTTSEPIKNYPNPTYTKEANSVNNMPASSSVYTDQTTSDDMRQPTLSANRAEIVSSSNSESTNQIIKEKESIERITSSQQSDNVSNANTVTAAAAPPPAVAGVLLPGIDESAIPSQPRVTKNNSATQRTSECEYARRSAGVSEAAAKKAKECDIECAKQRKILPKTVTPLACPIKDPAVNLLDTQLGNKP